MATDWDKVRAEFPALARWTFLNTATFGQLPRCATAAIDEHLARRDRFACDDFLEWFDDADRIRELIARLIGCAPHDIAFIPNASTGLSLLIGGMEWKDGDEVLTLEDEFPNHYYYPSYLGGAGVRFVETTYDRFYESVSPRTRLVAISTVNYSTGFRAPLAEMSGFLRERGVTLYVDGTQSLGALQFDVKESRPDMFAVHGYKWLLSPNGAGFMYVSPELRNRLQPAVIGWRSHRDWRNHEYLHHGTPEFKDDAERYEGGMLPFALLYAMGASIQMMLDIGPAAIEKRVCEVTEGTRSVLRGCGATLLSDTKPHHDSPIIAARFENADASTLARALKSRRVLVAARHGNLRVSPHFYNNDDDLAVFGTALGELLSHGG
jgi:selenocysteine lyase/cysteine desulfurase